jgi:glycosyltransferase involved in cell wall biosynthesis
LTPSWNQARWLPDNLASVAAQTYSNIEHIVMDGGSTDGSVDILSNASNVVSCSESDRGQSHALNKAFARSSGEIIGWLNADDFYFAGAVESAVEAFERNPDIDVVYGHAALVSGEGRLLHFQWSPPYNRRLLRRYNYIAQPAAFIRRAALEDGFVDEDYDSWMDRELWLRLSERCRFMRVNCVLAADRHHPARKSYRQDLAAADRRNLVEAYGKECGLSNAFEQQALRSLMRIAGVSLLFDDSAIPRLGVSSDGRRKVLVRQLGRRRVRM